MDSIRKFLPEKAEKIIAILVCCSALGAVHGLIFTGGRIFNVMGNDYPALRFFNKSETSVKVSRGAFLLQGGVALFLILSLGGFLNSILYTAATVYCFYFFTSLGVLILRKKDPHKERPYQATGYPYTIIIFCGVCLYLIYESLCYKPLISLIPMVFLIIGIPFYYFFKKGIYNK